MALLVLIVLGVLLGWMSSILARTEEGGAIMRQIGLSVLGALIAGLLTNNGTFLGGLSLWALGAAAGGSVLLLSIYHLVLRRNAA